MTALEKLKKALTLIDEANRELATKLRAPDVKNFVDNCQNISLKKNHEDDNIVLGVEHKYIVGSFRRMLGYSSYSSDYNIDYSMEENCGFKESGCVNKEALKLMSEYISLRSDIKESDSKLIDKENRGLKKNDLSLSDVNKLTLFDNNNFYEYYENNKDYHSTGDIAIMFMNSMDDKLDSIKEEISKIKHTGNNVCNACPLFKNCKRERARDISAKGVYYNDLVVMMYELNKKYDLDNRRDPLYLSARAVIHTMLLERLNELYNNNLKKENLL